MAQIKDAGELFDRLRWEIATNLIVTPETTANRDFVNGATDRHYETARLASKARAGNNTLTDYELAKQGRHHPDYASLVRGLETAAQKVRFR